jgi:glycosyltransferase involved in cell wall biosynthesis
LISVVIPTFGIEPVLDATIKAIRENFEQNDWNDFEILIVHTPKGDSVSYVSTIAKTHKPYVRVIIEQKKGYGVAYVTGFNNTRGNILITMDADMTYPCDCVFQLSQFLLRNSLDFITTDRLSKYEKGAFRWDNKFGNRFLTIVMNMLFLTGFKDSQSGMWVIRKSSLRKMKCYGVHWPFSAEIKIEAKRRGLRTLEVPILYRQRGGGESTNSILHGVKIAIFMVAKKFGLASIIPFRA